MPITRSGGWEITQLPLRVVTRYRGPVTYGREAPTRVTVNPWGRWRSSDSDEVSLEASTSASIPSSTSSTVASDSGTSTGEDSSASAMADRSIGGSSPASARSAPSSTRSSGWTPSALRTSARTTTRERGGAPCVPPLPHVLVPLRFSCRSAPGSPWRAHPPAGSLPLKTNSAVSRLSRPIRMSELPSGSVEKRVRKPLAVVPTG